MPQPHMGRFFLLYPKGEVRNPERPDQKIGKWKHTVFGRHHGLDILCRDSHSDAIYHCDNTVLRISEHDLRHPVIRFADYHHQKTLRFRLQQTRQKHNNRLKKEKNDIPTESGHRTA